MVWGQVKSETTIPHVSYATTGFALLLFGTISLFLKEKLYLGEASVATVYGLIVGPHCLNWFSPTTWGNTDYITLEISRIVLIVQIFAVAVELPKRYMLKHWWSVTMLLLPVMAFGWLVASVFIWKLIPTLRWIHALCIAGCVTATDPVLASAVVGKGKFARRVPGHLRNLLSAESACNDGMAFPFVIMAIDIIRDEHHPREIARDFICVGVLYECVLGILIGTVIGYGSRYLIKFAEKYSLIDRESFLAYFFCVALFCAGVGTLCGVDDLLVAFAAGTAFGWDGWFSKQTEESHVSNVFDTLLNTAFFVYFGAVVPWPDFNNADYGIRAWKLVCLSLIILAVRRIPIMLLIKPITPDIHTWREALFCGHFGPIGVGAVFMALLSRGLIENGSEEPPDHLPSPDNKNYYLMATIWPVTCFLVIASIIVHGSSVAVFTLGQRINNMAITLTYTTTAAEEPSWLSRLPRRGSGTENAFRLQRMETEEPLNRRFRRKRRISLKPSSDGAAAASDDARSAEHGLDISENNGVIPEHAGFRNEGVSAAHGASSGPDDEQHHQHHHRFGLFNGDSDGQRDEDRADREDEDAQSTLEMRVTIKLSDQPEPIVRTDFVAASKLEGKNLSDINTYREGDHIVVEDGEGTFIHQFNIGDEGGHIQGQPHMEIVAHKDKHPHGSSSSGGAGGAGGGAGGGASGGANGGANINGGHSESSEESKFDSVSTDFRSESLESGAKRPPYSRQTSGSTQRPRHRSLSRAKLDLPRKHGPHAYAYVIDDTVVVENEDGEILRRYKYVRRGSAPAHSKSVAHGGTGSGTGSGGHKGWRSYLTNMFHQRKPASPRDSLADDDTDEFKDVENTPTDMLIPDPDCPAPTNVLGEAMTQQDEERFQRSLSQMLRRGEIDRHESRQDSDPRRSSSSRRNTGLSLGSNGNFQTIRSQAVTDDDDYEAVTDDEDAEPETSVERHRRLAALGVIDNNDENARAEEMGDEDEPKITFQLPKRPA